MEIKRYLYLFLGTLTLLITGLMYNFTVFNEPIINDIGCNQSQISLAFSICQISLCCGGLILGHCYNKVKFNISMVIASLFLTIGLIFTSYAKTIVQVYIFYSILMNLSAGYLYKGVIAAVLPWFNDKPGLANGIMMLGAGLTAFVFNVPTTKLISIIGWRKSMRVLAVVAFVITFVVAITVRKKSVIAEHKNKKSLAKKEYETKEMIRSSYFYTYFIWSVLMLAGCTSITGNAISIARSIGINSQNAAVISMVISFFNSLGRVLYGILYDKKGFKASMLIVTTFFTLGAFMLQVGLVSKSVMALIIAFLGIGVAFGGIPTLSSTYILNMFGGKNYAKNYSVQGMFSLFSPIAGTSVFSIIYSMSNNYSLSYSYLVIYAIIGFLVFFMLNKLLEQEESYDK